MYFAKNEEAYKVRGIQMRTFVSLRVVSGNSSRVFPPACASECGCHYILLRVLCLDSALHTYAPLDSAAGRRLRGIRASVRTWPPKRSKPRLSADRVRSGYGCAPEDSTFGTASLEGDLARSEANPRATSDSDLDARSITRRNPATLHWGESL